MTAKPSRKKEWELTEEAFNHFLAWLNPNPEDAGRKYEDIRRRLIRIFMCRGCTCPEDLADDTIDRVIRKAQEIATNYVGDPALYFYGVAHKVFLEHVRKVPDPPPPQEPEPGPQAEGAYQCLELCMGRLTPNCRDLVLQYYQEERRAKIDHRKLLAARMGLPINALRIRAHRIRMNLQACVFECLQHRPTE